MPGEDEDGYVRADRQVDDPGRCRHVPHGTQGTHLVHGSGHGIQDRIAGVGGGHGVEGNLVGALRGELGPLGDRVPGGSARRRDFPESGHRFGQSVGGCQGDRLSDHHGAGRAGQGVGEQAGEPDVVVDDGLTGPGGYRHGSVGEVGQHPA